MLPLSLLSSILLITIHQTINQPVNSLDNGLAQTPPMGWSTWNTFRCEYDETDLHQIADTLISSGLSQAGYRYLNVDDCWEANQRTNGQLTWNSTRFPSGPTNLAKYIHDKGLLFGLYSSSGPFTCEGRPGSWTYEQVDAKSFAEWQVDFLKLDACVQFNVTDRKRAFEAMSSALLSSGRPILFSCDSDELILNENNQEFPSQWGPDVCNIARLHWDIWDEWISITDIMTAAQNVGHTSKKGYFNDLDILTVGMGGMSITEYITHFQLWCIFSSPLILGNDIRTMSEQVLMIVTNKEAIAINQDRLARAANMIRRSIDGTTEIWAKPLYDEQSIDQTNDQSVEQTISYPSRHRRRSYRTIHQSIDTSIQSIPEPDFHPWRYHAVVMVNRATIKQSITLLFADLFDHKLNPHPATPDFIALVHDAWNASDLGTFTNNITLADVPPHGSRMLTIRLKSPK